MFGGFGSGAQPNQQNNQQGSKQGQQGGFGTGAGIFGQMANQGASQNPQNATNTFAKSQKTNSKKSKSTKKGGVKATNSGKQQSQINQQQTSAFQPLQMQQTAMAGGTGGASLFGQAVQQQSQQPTGQMFQNAGQNSQQILQQNKTSANPKHAKKNKIQQKPGSQTRQNSAITPNQTQQNSISQQIVNPGQTGSIFGQQSSIQGASNLAFGSGLAQNQNRMPAMVQQRPKTQVKDRSQGVGIFGSGATNIGQNQLKFGQGASQTDPNQPKSAFGGSIFASQTQSKQDGSSFTGFGSGINQSSLQGSVAKSQEVGSESQFAPNRQNKKRIGQNNQDNTGTEQINQSKNQASNQTNERGQQQKDTFKAHNLAENGDENNNQQRQFQKKPCRNFFQSGSCQFGERCFYSHELSNEQSQMMSQVMEQMGVQKEDLEKFGIQMPKAQNTPNNASMERNSSSQPQKRERICTFFAKGKCTKGNKCTFAHKSAPDQTNEILKDDENNMNQKKFERKGESAKERVVDEESMKAQFDRIQRAKLQRSLQNQTTSQFETPDLPKQPFNQENDQQEEAKESEQGTAKVYRMKPRGKKVLRIVAPKPQEEDIQESVEISKPSTMNLRTAVETPIIQQEIVFRPEQQMQISAFNQSDVVKTYVDLIRAVGMSQIARNSLEKAACLQMCPDEEIERRSEVEMGAISNFEQNQQKLNFPSLAIRRYDRSAANKQMSDPKGVRPPVILYLTMSYMRDCLADQDRIPPGTSYYSYAAASNSNPSSQQENNLNNPCHDFNQVYAFMRDRFRQITQELIINDATASIYDVRATEELVRFLVLSYHDGFQQPAFELVQNTERLTHNLGRLTETYQTAEKAYKAGDISQTRYENLTKNQAEMLSYQIIATSGKTEGLKEIMSGQLAKFSPAEQNLIKQALEIRRVITGGNFVRFFRILRRGETNYFFACLMMITMLMMRQIGVQNLMAGFKLEKIDYALVRRQLLLTSESDAERLIAACGYEFVEGIPGQRPSMYRRTQSVEVWREQIKKWRQSGSVVELSNIRGERSRAILMKLGLDSFIQKEGQEITQNVPNLQEIIQLGDLVEDKEKAAERAKQIAEEAEKALKKKQMLLEKVRLQQKLEQAQKEKAQAELQAKLAQEKAEQEEIQRRKEERQKQIELEEQKERERLA